MGLEGFFGTYTPRMDDKGRITLPARYRAQFAEEAVLLRGQDHCLYLFTPDGFRQHAAPAMNAKLSDRRARGLQRFMFSNTDKQTPDAQGRISVPAAMRDYAGLSKDVVVLGSGTRMEIWDAATWAAYEQEQEAAYAEMDEDWGDQ